MMNVSAAFNEIEEKIEVERKKESEREKASRVIVRGERMKFTELHIAVVTFRPLEFIFPFSSCHTRFSWVT